MNQPSKHEPSQPSWVGPALLTVAGMIIGLISLALFCHAYGLNFQDEGWSQTSDGQTTNVKQGPLVAALIGVLIATVIFWVGFMRLTRQPR